MRKLAGAIAIVAGLAGAQGSAAAAKPDLTITKVSAAATVVQGRTLAVSDTVRNAGGGRAKASQVGYLLSKDARRSQGDRALGGRRKLKPLTRGKAAKGSRTVTVPATLAAGTYRLIACADPAGKLRERKERNNCRAAARPVRVLAAAGPVIPPAVTPGPAPTSSPTPTPQTSGPIKVSETLEAGGLTQKMYGGFENSMTVTGADGTKYTLTMPQDALLSAVDVTMTPVDAIGGLPLSKGLVAAVRLEPHGLRLHKPATLTIEPPAGTPVAEQTAFLYHQGGHDFHLYPLGPERTLTMRLMHFSTPGVGLAGPGDRAGVLANTPGRAEAQLEQATSESARQDRANGLGESPGDSPAVPDPSTVFPPYYDDVVRPKLIEAETNDALAREAIAEALSWARNAELMGMENDPEYQRRRDEMNAKIETILRNAAEKAYQRCVLDHDLEQIVRLAALARIEALMGFDLGDVFEQKFKKCTNFEVELDSALGRTDSWTGQGEGGLSYDLAAAWRVVSKIPIDFTAVGTADLAWSAFSYEGTKHLQCSGDSEFVSREQDVSATAGTMMGLVSLDLNPREAPPEGEPAPAPPDDYVQIFVTKAPTETYQQWNEGCDNPFDPTTDTQSRWNSLFNSFHAGETPVKMRIDRAAQEGDLIQDKTWSRARGGRDSSGAGSERETELTTLSLWHRPLP